MSPNALIVICIFIWGITTFMQKLSADKMSPALMQIIIGIVFVLGIPIFIKLGGGWGNLKWNATSIAISAVATVLAICANIMMYTALSNNKNTGSTAMLIALYPAVTLILSAIFLHEQFTWGKIAGVLAMISGACLLTFC